MVTYALYGFSEIANDREKEVVELNPFLFLWSSYESCIEDNDDACFSYEEINDSVELFAFAKRIINEKNPQFYVLMWPDQLISDSGSEDVLKAYTGKKTQARAIL